MMCAAAVVSLLLLIPQVSNACDGIPGIAAEELDARFAMADTNKDGKLDRSEFAAYQNVMKTLKPVSIVKFCPKTNKPCEHNKTLAGQSEVSLIPVKAVSATFAESVTEKTEKSGGCCGSGKAKASEPAAAAEPKKSGGCCGK
jgi:hypothetical protein